MVGEYAPLVTDATIHIVLVMIIMAGWIELLDGLYIWLSWMDECLIDGMNENEAGKNENVQEATGQMMRCFDCEEVGELKEYVDCKVDHNREEGCKLALVTTPGPPAAENNSHYKR